MRRCQAAAWNRLPPAWQEVAERAVKNYFSWDCNGSPALFTKKSALCIIDNLSPCVREPSASHWETGKGRPAMIEVRRPALARNLKSAVYGLTFLQV